MAGPQAHASACADAADRQEQSAAIPGHLLRSIAAVESAGRPWSVNADGVGRSFGSKQDAIDYVRQVTARGARFVDVGCFQIDLAFHPEAFADLDEAFDPAANAAYAARFLVSLHAGGPDWHEAVGAYHSRDPARGGPYRDLVYAAAGGVWPAFVPAAPRLQFGMRVVVPGVAWAPPPGSGLPRVYEP